MERLSGKSQDFNVEENWRARKELAGEVGAKSYTSGMAFDIYLFLTGT